MRNDFFEMAFAKYGQWDYCVYAYEPKDPTIRGWCRFRCYHDGAWLEGYDLEEIIYWGA